MVETLSPTLALEELARVLNVWSEHSFVITTRPALTQWARQTAAFTPRHPRPAAGISLLMKLNLATSGDRDELHADSVLTSLMPAPADVHDRFSGPVAANVFLRLLALPECVSPLQQVLSCPRVSQGQLTFPWRQIPATLRANMAWIWLQQLGLAWHEGANVVLDAILIPYATDSLPTHRTLSQAELEERLAAQKARAALAEEFVMETERQRLIACGCPHYAVGVRRVSIENVDAGYDIRSFEMTGAPRLIEVKSSAGPRNFFFISRNEYRSARRRGASYWIAWVGWAARLPDAPCEIAWFRNPAKIMKAESSPWRVTATQVCVQRIGDDAAFQTVP
jgi:Domain of unknown function (DUF3883)